MRRLLVKQSPVMALSLLASTFAQSAEPTTPLPGAGSILQQTQPNKPAPAPSGSTGLRVEQPEVGVSGSTPPFPVTEIHITGNTLFDEATLHALVAGAEGRSLTLAELSDVAARITRYYQDHGYPLARAVIPAQAVHGGVVQLLVVEARYGKVQLDNRGPVSDSLLSSTLSPLQAGKQIEQKALDHSLLLLTDVPGVVIAATLKPGDAIGTSDLVVDAADGQRITADVSVDNYGNRYTGRPRLGGSVGFIDLMHHGDVLRIDALSSGDRMNYGQLAEDVLLNGLGTHVGASYSALQYKLGGSLSSLGGHGAAGVASTWARQPFVRSRDASIYGQFQYDRKRLADDVDSTGLHTDRHLDDLTVTVSGDWRDAGGTGGASLALARGRLQFDDAAAEAADALTARTQRAFLKWNGTVSRVQTLAANDAVVLVLSGQWANSNLDASEKMVAGGPYTVRAYDMGVLSGDRGVFASAEWQHELGQVIGGRTQAIAFVDSERITLNRTTWVAGANSASLSGAGLGLDWQGLHQSSVRAVLAAPVGATPALAGAHSSVRAWVEVKQVF